jgi:opacity protein-like surface antigen
MALRPALAILRQQSRRQRATSRSDRRSLLRIARSLLRMETIARGENQVSRAIRSIQTNRILAALMASMTLSLAGNAGAAGSETEPAEANERKGTRYYVTGLAGGAWATGAAEGVTLADGEFASSSKGQSAFGGAAAGTIFDLGWSDLRLEIEGTGGRSFRFTTPSAIGLYVTDADTWTLQGNFWFEYSLGRLFPEAPIVRNLAPFAGGGLGLSRTSLASTNGVASGSSESSTLAWQAGAGLSYQALPWLSFEARYQYADLGGPSVPLYSAGARQGELGVDIGTHEVVGGIRFIFSEL